MPRHSDHDPEAQLARMEFAKAMLVACPACGDPNNPIAPRCAACGADLPSAREALEAMTHSASMKQRLEGMFGPTIPYGECVPEAADAELIRAREQRDFEWPTAEGGRILLFVTRDGQFSVQHDVKESLWVTRQTFPEFEDIAAAVAFVNENAAAPAAVGEEATP